MDISSPLRKLKEYIELEDFKGYDPYDALNSPFLKFLSFNQKWPRITFIQLLKRLPVNIRAILGIQKDYNPKGLGLLLWGYAKLYKIEKKEEYIKRINSILDLLEDLRSSGYSGNCWGYNFDWQSRAFYVPKYTPTIVNSSLIGHALLDTYLYTGKQQALDMAVSIKDFILNNLYRKEENNTICFSYTPIDDYYVHNANLLGASLLIRIIKYGNDNDIKKIALSSLAYTMNYQRRDGSWFYSENKISQWIDSFHTGFNLQSILYFIKDGFAEEYKDAFNKGIKFYCDNFFLNDGLPKYYSNKVYPIDIHSPSQAVVFFSRLGDSHKTLTDQIIKWMIKNLQGNSGNFYFQKMKYYTNKISYIRWGQAWAFHALTEYYLHKYKYNESH
jgi:hypothetical protein